MEIILVFNIFYSLLGMLVWNWRKKSAKDAKKGKYQLEKLYCLQLFLREFHFNVEFTFEESNKLIKHEIVIFWQLSSD